VPGHVDTRGRSLPGQAVGLVLERRFLPAAFGEGCFSSRRLVIGMHFQDCRFVKAERTFEIEISI
jgi:hypothetical protein